MGMSGIAVFVRQRFFGSWDRALTSVSLFASLIGAAVTVSLLRYPDQIPYYIIYRDLGVLIGLLIISAVLLVRFIRQEVTLTAKMHAQEVAREAQIQMVESQLTELSKHLKLEPKSFQEAHILVHNYRDELFKTYSDHLIVHQLTRDEQRLFSRICDYVTDSIRDSLLHYFRFKRIDIGEDVHVSVKLVVSPSAVIEHIPNIKEEKKRQIQTKNKWIITIYRDHYTYLHHRDRETHSSIYSIDGNTAYHHIVNLGHQCFVSNDLRSMGPTYHNENPNWRQHYNAALVVPIRYHCEDVEACRCFGLLTADSLNEKRLALYDECICRDIMAHAADLLATFFVLLMLSKHIPINVANLSGQ